VASNISQAKARLSALSRHRNPSDPAVARARAELEAAVRADREARRQAVQSDPEYRMLKISEAIKKEALGDPLLSDAQRAALAALLLPPGDAHGTA
jgi:hypothetical protein